MSCNFNSCFNDCDRSLLNLSSKLTQPLCDGFGLVRYRLVAPLDPTLLDNCASIYQEIAFRVLIVAGAAIALYLTSQFPLPVIGGLLAYGALTKMVRVAGFALQKDGYTHVQGSCSEKEIDNKFKVMTWNVCGMAGNMAYDHGGVIEWSSPLQGIDSQPTRVQKIIEKIIEQDADVVVLNEIYDTALAEALVQGLHNNYAHSYMHLGHQGTFSVGSILGSIGGVLVLTKCFVHSFSNEEFTTNDWTLGRSFATLEIKKTAEDRVPCARIIGTHLSYKQNGEHRAQRKTQMEQIHPSISSRNTNGVCPTILAGDLNIEYKEEESSILNSYQHTYSGDEITCTEKLVAKWDGDDTSPERTIDYISLFTEEQCGCVFTSASLVKAWDESYNTQKALSDHQGLVTEFTLGNPSLNLA